MKLLDVVRRHPIEPWSGVHKIPWDEPEFSARMLREHLSQEHDAASRRFLLIERHVGWIHRSLLAEHPCRVLDLGCGPGLYTSRLARLGHECVGIDFSPASIEHARSEAEAEGLACHYRTRDLRAGEFGTRFNLAMLIFGELNTFPPSDARSILANAAAALSPGGTLLLEVYTDAFVRELGTRPPTWYSAPSGLFSDAPHVCLREATWFETARACVERYFVIVSDTGELSSYVSTGQAYSEDDYSRMVSDAGLADEVRHPSLTGEETEGSKGLFVLTARKP